MIEIYENEKIVFSVTTDESITGATELKYVLAKQRKSPTAVITKTLGSGVTITGSNTFTVELDPEDTDGKAGTYQHQARVTDATGDPNTIRLTDEVVKIHKTYAD